MFYDWTRRLCIDNAMTTASSTTTTKVCVRHMFLYSTVRNLNPIVKTPQKYQLSRNASSATPHLLAGSSSSNLGRELSHVLGRDVDGNLAGTLGVHDTNKSLEDVADQGSVVLRLASHVAHLHADLTAAALCRDGRVVGDVGDFAVGGCEQPLLSNWLTVINIHTNKKRKHAARNGSLCRKKTCWCFC